MFVKVCINFFTYFPKQNYLFTVVSLVWLLNNLNKTFERLFMFCRGRLACSKNGWHRIDNSLFPMGSWGFCIGRCLGQKRFLNLSSLNWSRHTILHKLLLSLNKGKQQSAVICFEQFKERFLCWTGKSTIGYNLSSEQINLQITQLDPSSPALTNYKRNNLS